MGAGPRQGIPMHTSCRSTQVGRCKYHCLRSPSCRRRGSYTRNECNCSRNNCLHKRHTHDRRNQCHTCTPQRWPAQRRYHGRCRSFHLRPGTRASSSYQPTLTHKCRGRYRSAPWSSCRDRCRPRRSLRANPDTDPCKCCRRTQSSMSCTTRPSRTLVESRGSNHRHRCPAPHQGRDRGPSKSSPWSWLCTGSGSEARSSRRYSRSN